MPRAWLPGFRDLMTEYSLPANFASRYIFPSRQETYTFELKGLSNKFSHPLIPWTKRASLRESSKTSTLTSSMFLETGESAGHAFQKHVAANGQDYHNCTYNGQDLNDQLYFRMVILHLLICSAG